jgi:hypothetical protein
MSDKKISIEKEFKEIVSICLDALDVEKKAPFIVETMDLDVNIMVDNDTLIPVLLLYIDYMTQTLFEEKYIDKQTIFKTNQSLFYVKWDNKSSGENFYLQTHIKILLIYEFLKRFKTNKNKINLTLLVSDWRDAIENNFQDNEHVFIEKMKDKLSDQLFHDLILVNKK